MSSTSTIRFNSLHFVVGVNYGDEGKGQTTREICEELIKKNERPINVRYGGSAQAGHTVITGDQRIVYKHLGAGSFIADTYLAEDFILNPIEFHTELTKLKNIGYKNSCMCHPKCIITTPEMMMLNQLAELSRGDDAHGSCGMGVYESILAKNSGVSFTFEKVSMKASSQDIHDYFYSEKAIDYYLQRLDDIQRYSTNKSTKFSENVIEVSDIITNKTFSTAFMESVRYMLDNIQPTLMAMLPSMYTSAVFESSQGLMLTELYGEMPHCTPSIVSPSEVADKLSAALFEPKKTIIHFVTRSYATRHGNGPLKGESTEGAMHLKVYDPTNVPNEFQGAIRYAPLDTDRIGKIINIDLGMFITKTKWSDVKMELTVTCLGQSSDTIKTLNGDLNLFEFIEKFNRSYSVENFRFSWLDKSCKIRGVQIK